MYGDQDVNERWDACRQRYQLCARQREGEEEGQACLPRFQQHRTEPDDGQAVLTRGRADGHARRYHIAKNDLVVIPMPARVSNLAAHDYMQVEWFAADYKFLQNLLPSNNYSIGGSIFLNHDPIISLTDEQAAILLADFHRMKDRHLLFYRVLMGSLCLSMMYDFFEPHAQRDATDTHSDRTPTS